MQVSEIGIETGTFLLFPYPDGLFAAVSDFVASGFGSVSEFLVSP